MELAQTKWLMQVFSKQTIMDIHVSLASGKTKENKANYLSINNVSFF